MSSAKDSTAREPRSLGEKLIEAHLVEGRMTPGEEIALRIDQTLTQDATGTLVMLELEAMRLDRVRTELSVQYVDHNLIQQDHKNPDDHVFLFSACRRFGLWYSRPGNGVSHPVHMQRFGRPGATLLGSDSHTCAAGALGMLAIGTGGLDVALAMAGEPYRVKMPAIWGVRLSGALPPWVSAKDVVLEMLRRHGVAGGVGRLIEYYGPGLESLSAMDRHVIANMGAELGATTSVFPSDGAVQRFLRAQDRESDWQELRADDGVEYDISDEIDLSKLEPLIARPSSPGDVVPVRAVAGTPIQQAYVGSSANPGLRDFAICARMVRDRQIPPEVSFDVNPTSRQQLETLAREGYLADLIRSGARLHQTGCNGCIGMGQAPASKTVSLRTVPRNFPGRSGTAGDQVFLCSPETATASALRGAITDPRDAGLTYPQLDLPEHDAVNTAMLVAPPPAEVSRRAELIKGPNIESLPDLDPLPETLSLPVLLTLEDDVSTDEILPAGARVLPFRSNIPRISDFAFEPLDGTYARRARESGAHAIVAGRNYGQGSSREHAALATRFLGLRLVLARSFARIHWQNLVNFGVLPLTLSDSRGAMNIERGDVLRLENAPAVLRRGADVVLVNSTRDCTVAARHALSERQVAILLCGGLIPWMRSVAGRAH